MSRYHVNARTHFERDLYVEADSEAEAAAKVREQMQDADFWEREHWSVAEDGDTDLYVEASA